MTHSRTLALLGFFFAALSNACAPVVIDGTGSGGGSSSGPTESTSSSTTSCTDCANAIAIRYGDIPPLSGDVGSSGSTGGGSGGPDPDTLLIIVSNQPVSCSNPWAAGDDCNSWAVYLDVPVQNQAPGALDLATANGSSSESGSNGDGTCWGGGGSFTDGTLSIDTIDDATVAGQLAGTDTFDFDANGAFVAMRCPATH